MMNAILNKPAFDRIFPQFSHDATSFSTAIQHHVVDQIVHNEQRLSQTLHDVNPHSSHTIF